MVTKLELVVCTAITGVLGYTVYNTINKEFVEEGYPNPSKINVMSENLRGDGKRQTILEYKGDRYLVRLQGNGDLKFEKYVLVHQLDNLEGDLKAEAEPQRSSK